MDQENNRAAMSEQPQEKAPLPLSDILIEEGEQIYGPLTPSFKECVEKRLTDAARRRVQSETLQTNSPPAAMADSDEQRAKERRRCQAVYDEIHRLPARPSALCLSGGGIRSATFNLGVMQALAKLRLLEHFDYLSTVSGGGYAGAWLSAWVHRLKRAGKDGIRAVQDELQDRHLRPDTHTAEPRPIEWLRDYSNYLTPKLGLFSIDCWTAIGTFLRNLLLTWSILLPLLVAAGMVPRLQIAMVRERAHWPLTPTLWAVAGLGLLGVALTYFHRFRPGYVSGRLIEDETTGHTNQADSSTRFQQQRWFMLLGLLPLVAAAICLTTAWAWHLNGHRTLSEISLFVSPFATFVLLGTMVHVIPWAIANWFAARRHSPSSSAIRPFLIRVWSHRLEALVIAASGAIGGASLWAILYVTSPKASLEASVPTFPTVGDFAEWYGAFAVPGFLGLFLLIGTLFIGLSSQNTSDQEHEYWGRIGSIVLQFATILAALAGLIVFGPGLLATLGVWTAASIGGTAGILSLIGGFSAKTLIKPSTQETTSSTVFDALVRWATPLFIMLLVVVLALTTSAVIDTLSHRFLDNTLSSPDKQGQGPAIGALMPETDHLHPSMHAAVLHNAPFSMVAGLWVGLVLFGLAMALGININKFSLHGFYRNRLIRAYLGASRGVSKTDVRLPHRLTGFDPKDNVYMAELAGHDFTQAPDDTAREQRQVQKPFHVINIALNLVRTDKLAWQQRKAQSFTVSPLHCGSWDGVGYRPSKEYGYNAAVKRPISLGTAMAISGAAASPNMGYHSSPAVTFLLALFNIRLGWWIGNPGKATSVLPDNRIIDGIIGRMNLQPTYQRACPKFALRPLLAELFGLTDRHSAYVYLSDGGHFENLGLYEMVLRRCHHIVVVDAGCDPDLTFEDLGNAIRKVRIDLGVDIEINVAELKRVGNDRLSQCHHAIGSIRYDKVDVGAPVGTLIYLKPSLKGEEPSDVQDYAAHHHLFPHEPTSDQFFDEAQFESYRRLGEHIAWDLFQESRKQPDQSLDQTIEQLVKR